MEPDLSSLSLDEIEMYCRQQILWCEKTLHAVRTARALDVPDVTESERAILDGIKTRRLAAVESERPSVNDAVAHVQQLREAGQLAPDPAPVVRK